MREEIQKALVRLQIEAKETRRKTRRNILIVYGLVLLFFLIPYFYSQLNFLFAIDILLVLFGSIYLITGAIPTLRQPLKTEFYAFQEIAHAIDILDKLNEPIAYEEAYRYLRRAYGTLKDIDLDSLEWYSQINESLERFLENLRLIILPSVAESNIKKEHLEEIALAVYSIDPSKIETVNGIIEKESSYKKSLVMERKVALAYTVHQRIEGFLSSHKILKHSLAVSTFVAGCGIFYYVAVTYLNIQREYVFTTTVGIFVALMTLYFRKKREILVRF